MNATRTSAKVARALALGLCLAMLAFVLLGCLAGCRSTTEIRGATSDASATNTTTRLRIGQAAPQAGPSVRVRVTVKEPAK